MSSAAEASRYLPSPSATIEVDVIGGRTDGHDQKNGPAKEDVQQEDSCGVMRVAHPGNDGRREIEYETKDQEVHRRLLRLFPEFYAEFTPEVPGLPGGFWSRCGLSGWNETAAGF